MRACGSSSPLVSVARYTASRHQRPLRASLIGSSSCSPSRANPRTGTQECANTSTGYLLREVARSCRVAVRCERPDQRRLLLLAAHAVREECGSATASQQPSLCSAKGPAPAHSCLILLFSTTTPKHKPIPSHPVCADAKLYGAGICYSKPSLHYLLGRLSRAASLSVPPPTRRSAAGLQVARPSPVNFGIHCARGARHCLISSTAILSPLRNPTSLRINTSSNWH